MAERSRWRVSKAGLGIHFGGHAVSGHDVGLQDLDCTVGWGA